MYHHMLSIKSLLFTVFMSLPAVRTQEKVHKLPAPKRVVLKFLKNTDLYQIGMILGIKSEMY